MAEINNAFKVKKGLDVTGDAAMHGNAMVDGYITVPTLAAAENSTKVATTAFVQTAIANLVANSPSTLNTLNELATALGNDPNFATTMTNQLALKAPLASPALTGTPTAPTVAITDNSTTLATTAYVKNQLYATLASPAFTGTVTAPTATFGDNTTKVATTAFVTSAMAATGFGYDAAAVPGGATASIDTNTIVSGLYVVTTSNTGTKPGGLTKGFLMVAREAAGTNAHQIYFDDASARSFQRSYSGAAWSAWREAAYTDSPAFTGSPTAPTAAQFDNTTKLATTAFVKQAQGNAAGTANFNTNTTLSLTYLGYEIQWYGPTGGILTLPTISTIPAGYGYNIYNQGSGTLIIQVAAADTSGFIYSGSPVSSVTLQKGDNIVLTARGNNELDITGGTASLQYVQSPLLVSPAISGIPTAPTASPNTNSTQLATTAYADAIAALKANINNPAFTGAGTFAGSMSSVDYVSFPFVNGGSFVTNATQTGALKIRLPVAYVGTFVCFDVDVYEYTTDGSFRLRIFGYPRTSSSTWEDGTVTMVGGVASRLPNVRFGNDGTGACVWIGELTDSWSYPNVNISNVHLGYGSLTSAWQNPWSLSYVTTFDTVKVGPIAANKAAFINSPAFTGVPTVPTPAATDNSTTIPNTSWVNSAIAASGSTSIVSIPVTSTAMTLTAAQYQNSMIVFTGALTGNTTITVPNTAHAFIAANNTTGSYTLTISSQGKTPSVQVVQNKANSLFCDTTGVYATSSTTGVQFAKQITLTANTTLDLSYLGTVVFVTTSGVTITLPLANTYPAGAGFNIINRSSGSINIARSGSDSFDEIASPLVLYPADSYFLESDNVNAWHTAWYSNERAPKYKQSVSAPRVLAGGVTDDGSTSVQGVVGNFSGKLNSVNATNMLFNGSGEFGNIGWNGTNFASTPGSYGEGYIFLNGSAINTSTYVMDYSTNFACGAGTQVTISGEIYTNGLTQGNVYMKLEAFDNTGTFISQITATTSITPATKGGYKFVWATGTCPANCVAIRISKVADGAAQISQYGVAFRRMKVEVGSTPSLYSLEANFPKMLLKDSPVITSGGLTFADGTVQSTANGVTAPTSTVYTPAANATSIATSGYNTPFVEVFKNNLRLIPTVDFTLPDGVNINLTTAATGRDRYEVLTKVIYSPSAVFQPTSTSFNVAVSGTTITVNYNVNCVWVFKNSMKLIPVTDYTATNGTSITLVNASESATDVYEVVTFTPFAVNGMLPLTGGTMTGNLTVSTAAAANNTNLNANAGYQRTTTYQTAGSNRFVEGVSSDAESGSNAGSNWYLARYSDAGAWVDNPLFVSRQSGLVTLSQGITLPDGYTSVVTPAGRNRFINGDMRVNQRGAISVVANTVTYVADRWYVWSGGSTANASNSWAGPGFPSALNVAPSATGNTTINIGQRIESVNSYSMASKTVTVSGWMWSDVAITPSLVVYTPNAKDNFSANTVVSNTNLSALVGSTWTFVKYTFTAPAAATNGLQIEFDFPNVGSGKTVALTGMQFEMGGSATPYEHVDYGEMLRRCQRYYYQLSAPQWAPNFPGVVYTTSNAMCKMPIPVQQRTAPTVSITGAGQWYLVNSGGNLTFSGSTYPGATDIQLTFTGSSLTTGGNMIGNSSATPFLITVSSEL